MKYLLLYIFQLLVIHKCITMMNYLENTTLFHKCEIVLKFVLNKYYDNN